MPLPLCYAHKTYSSHYHYSATPQYPCHLISLHICPHSFPLFTTILGDTHWLPYLCPFVWSPFFLHHHAPISSLSFAHHTHTSILTIIFMPHACTHQTHSTLPPFLSLQTLSYPFHHSLFVIHHPAMFIYPNLSARHAPSRPVQPVLVYRHQSPRLQR